MKNENIQNQNTPQKIFTEDELWEAVVALQGHLFRTVSGLPFTYRLKKGRNGQLTRELWIDRRENSKSLAWSSVRLAFLNAQKAQGEISRPKALGDIRGISYIYPVFWKLGLIQVQKEAEEKMKMADEDFCRQSM